CGYRGKLFKCKLPGQRSQSGVASRPLWLTAEKAMTCFRNHLTPFRPVISSPKAEMRSSR
ncbi:hypothetical protein LEMLEM_LOCUS2032, partial [Lemmus lemmus]